MDDDITFGASVWATSEPAESSIPKLAPAPLAASEDDHGFDDFDDFGPAETAPESSLQDDDFGDFDDFTDGAAGTSGFEDVLGFANQVAGPSTYSPWAPLSLNPSPTKEKLQEDVDVILAPLWSVSEIEAGTTDEPIREAEGIAQILVTPSRYVFFALQCSSLTQILVEKCIVTFYNSPLQCGRQTGRDRVSADNTSSLWVFL